jgi:hypothetical protein
MKAITLRNLPPDLAKAVRREAERKQTSINKAVISLAGEQSRYSEEKEGSKTALPRAGRFGWVME